MKPIYSSLIFFLAVTLSSNAKAVVSVNSLNFPVWVERGEQLEPLAPGDKLLVGDVVQTGSKGRVWLSIEDGSVVKLGQETRFVVNQAKFQSEENETILEAGFNVLKGAFPIHQPVLQTFARSQPSDRISILEQ